MIKLLLYDVFPIEKEQLAKIEALGYEIMIHHGEKTPLTQEECECEVMLQNWALSTLDVTQCKNLKFIQSCLAGTDHIPFKTLKEMGIKYSNGRGLYSKPIAEFTLMRILEIYRKSRLFDTFQKNKIWELQFEGFELSEKSVALLGTGSIAQEIAKRLKAFDTCVTGFNRSLKKEDYFDEIKALSSLKNEISQFDIVIDTLPATPETKGIMSRDMFAQMKDNSIFINVGRGLTVDEAALSDALQSGKLLAAASDVFEKEPLPKDSPLWDLDNFYYSPHSCFFGDLNNTRRFQLLYENLKSYIKGGDFINIVQ